MKLLSEAFDTVKRVYAYEKSVKADTATLQKIMAVFAIVMILIDVENIRLGKYIIGAATFFVAAVSLVAVWALDYFKNVYRVCRIAAVILLVLAVPIIFMGANDGFSLLWYLLGRLRAGAKVGKRWGRQPHASPPRESSGDDPAPDAPCCGYDSCRFHSFRTLHQFQR